MLNIPFIALVLLIGGTSLVCVLVAFRGAKHLKGIKRYLYSVGCCFLFLGIAGWFSFFVASSGGSNWLPSTFEWPVGIATGIVRSTQDYYIVPHTPVGRIQLYDLNLRFIRGWSVDAAGGTFAVNVSEPNVINVFTARGNHHYRYDYFGRLLTSALYPRDQYTNLSGGHTLSLVFYPFPLFWPLTHPFVSWGLGALGAAMMALLQRMKIKANGGKTKKSVSSKTDPSPPAE